jgi:preprotein translocase subunit SecD
MRIVLEPEAGAEEQLETSLDAALDEAVAAIERRLDAFDIEGSAERSDGERIVVELDDAIGDDTVALIAQRGLLQFCEPLTDAAGRVAVAGAGSVRYKPHSCEPERDAQGEVVIDGGTAGYVEVPPGGLGTSWVNVIWKPATAQIGSTERALTGEFLEPDTSVTTDATGIQVLLVFNLNDVGALVMEEVTQRLAEGYYPLAPFLDGEPVRGEDGSPIAPSVRGVITDMAQISGLDRGEAEKLSELLNAGAYPLPLRVVGVERPEA